MKKFFTLLAVALMAMGANAQTDFGTLSVVGNKAIEGSDADWDVAFTGSEMTKQADGSYTFTRENVTLEAGTNYEYKVVQNHSWDAPNLNWGVAGGNAAVSVTETAVYTVTITLVPDADGQNSPTSTTTKTGEAEEIAHVYSVAGAPADLFGGMEWNAENPATEMTLCEDENSENYGLYTYVVKNYPLTMDGSYSFKVCVDHGWGTAYPSDNYNIVPEADGSYDITFTFDATTKAVNAVLSEPTVDGIDAVKTAEFNTTAPMFNLAGQRVDKAYKGVVIQNGKKFVNAK